MTNTSNYLNCIPKIVHRKEILLNKKYIKNVFKRNLRELTQTLI